MGKQGVKQVVDSSSRRSAIEASSSSLIARLFCTRIRSEVTYGQTKTSATFSNLLHFSLSLAYTLPFGEVTLYDAIDAYFKEGIANANNGSEDIEVRSAANKESTAGKASKKETRTRDKIDFLPPVLILQLKRFNFDRKRGAAIKIQRRIGIPEVLELSSEYYSDDLIATLEAEMQQQAVGQLSAKYSLSGAVLHHGDTITSGHYTAIVANPNPSSAGSYLHINDAKSNVLTAAKALSPSSEVYVLIYSKMQK